MTTISFLALALMGCVDDDDATLSLQDQITQLEVDVLAMKGRLEASESDVAALTTELETMGGSTTLADLAVEVDANTLAIAVHEARVTANEAGIDRAAVLWSATIRSDLVNDLELIQDGVSYGLDATSAVVGDVVYGPAGMMILDLSADDPMLLINIDAAASLECALFSAEDDVPRYLGFAVDSGNNYVEAWQAAGYACKGEDCPNTAIVQNASGGGAYAMANAVSMSIICVQ
jgi:hypothetical protein